MINKTQFDVTALFMTSIYIYIYKKRKVKKVDVESVFSSCL